MKKEILLLSSLISLAFVFYLSFPVEENIDDQKLTFEEKSELFHSEINDLTGEEIFLGFDIVRLDPSGSVIIAGKTQPNITVDIFDGNQKLSSVISDSHGDWVWVSEEKIKDGLKRFHSTAFGC